MNECTHSFPYYEQLTHSLTLRSVHVMKYIFCKKIYVSQKQWVHVYPLGSRSIGTGEKQWVIYPGCRGKKIPGKGQVLGTNVTQI